MNIDTIRKMNNELKIMDLSDINFRQYGRVLNNIDCSLILDYAEKSICIPKKGTKYCESVKELETFSVVDDIKYEVYGGLDIEVGCCSGQNTMLTGLEYHQGSETIVAVTDCIIMVGRLQDMKDCTYESKNIESFYVKKGQVVELYTTTLHYTPCNVSENGFITLVVLLKGTNTVIEKDHNKLLTKKNKYFITHPSQEQKVKNGAIPGFVGDIPEIKLDYGTSGN